MEPRGQTNARSPILCGSLRSVQVREDCATSGPSKTSELLLDEGDGADEAG